MYKRVLLKLSGEALSNGKDNPFYQEHLQNVALEVKEVVKEGIQAKLSLLPENARCKLQHTLCKLVNKGSGNLFAIVLKLRHNPKGKL